MSVTLTDRQVGQLRRIVNVLQEKAPSDGIVLSRQEFRLLREMLEDFEDLQAIRKSEAEFARGQSQPVEEYLRDRRQRTPVT